MATFAMTPCLRFSVEEKEIIALEKRYSAIKSTSNTMQMDINLFCQLVSPPLPDSLSCGQCCEDLFVYVCIHMLMYIYASIYICVCVYNVNDHIRHVWLYNGKCNKCE